MPGHARTNAVICCDMLCWHDLACTGSFGEYMRMCANTIEYALAGSRSHRGTSGSLEARGGLGGKAWETTREPGGRGLWARLPPWVF